MEPVTLRTPRLELSIPVAADIAAITEAAQDPDVPRWTTLPSPYTRSHAEDFITQSATRWDNGTDLVWAIRVEGAWVGSIGLHGVSLGGAAEIGFWMAAPARAHGYLTEAATGVIDFAFAEPLSLARIEWRAVVGKVPSARAARALGFRYEGMARQALTDPRGRYDGWVAGLLATDDRAPQAWEVLG